MPVLGMSQRPQKCPWAGTQSVGPAVRVPEAAPWWGGGVLCTTGLEVRRAAWPPTLLPWNMETVHPCWWKVFWSLGELRGPCWHDPSAIYR